VLHDPPGAAAAVGCGEGRRTLGPVGEGTTASVCPARGASCADSPTSAHVRSTAGAASSDAIALCRRLRRSSREHHQLPTGKVECGNRATSCAAKVPLARGEHQK